MKYTIFTAAAAMLASAVTATPMVSERAAAPTAVANLIAVNHPVSGTSSDKAITVPIGKLTHYDNVKITGFQVVGVTVKDVPNAPRLAGKQVECRMYKDQFGLQPGSAVFTKAEEALISTNTVEMGWVLCYIKAA